MKFKDFKNGDIICNTYSSGASYLDKVHSTTKRSSRLGTSTYSESISTSNGGVKVRIATEKEKH